MDDIMVPADLSTESGWSTLYEYLRKEYKDGKREFRLAFQDVAGPTHFIIHPMGKDGDTADFVLTNGDVI